MRFRNTLVKIILALVIVASFTLTVFAGVDYKGGVWSYGGHHEIGNWGAFSNFYHGTKWHSSSVISYKDSTADYDSRGPKETSKAFINTDIGEEVKFEADAEDN